MKPRKKKRNNGPDSPKVKDKHMTKQLSVIVGDEGESKQDGRSEYTNVILPGFEHLCSARLQLSFRT